MKRALLVAMLALSLAVSSLGVTGCKVKVQSGTRYLCTYGEKLGSDIKDLQVKKADAAKYTVKTQTITCSRHQQAEAAYAKAQAALKSGDAKTAKADLAKVVKLDPDFKKAAAQLDQLAKGGKPAPDAGPIDAADKTDPKAGGKTPPPGDNPKPPPGDQSPGMNKYLDLVPDEIPGFTAERFVGEDVSLTRAYVPKDKSKYDQLVIMIQQFDSESSAKRGIDTNIKGAYSGSPSSVSLPEAGLKGGYFGTNGSGFAVVSIVNGDALVTLELHATGAKASSLKSELIRLAEIILAT